MTTRPRETTLIRRFFASRWFLFVALVLAVIVAIGYARAYYQDYQVKQEISALQVQTKALEKKKLQSIEILKYVSSPEFVEEKARTELNFKKPGEQVAVVNGLWVEDAKTNEPPVEKSLLNNPIKWWYYFIHKNLNLNQ
jgi:cell division protein FtsB